MLASTIPLLRKFLRPSSLREEHSCLQTLNVTALEAMLTIKWDILELKQSISSAVEKKCENAMCTKFCGQLDSLKLWILQVEGRNRAVSDSTSAAMASLYCGQDLLGTKKYT